MIGVSHDQLLMLVGLFVVSESRGWQPMRPALHLLPRSPCAWLSALSRLLLHFIEPTHSVMLYKRNVPQSCAISLGIRCIFSHCQGLCNSVECPVSNKTDHTHCR